MAEEASLQKRVQEGWKEEGLVLRRLQVYIEHRMKKGALVRIHI